MGYYRMDPAREVTQSAGGCRARAPTKGASGMTGAREVLDELRTPTRELRKAAPEAWAGFAKLHDGAIAEGELSTRVKELIALAIAVVKQCDGCIAAHTAGRCGSWRDARRGGRGPLGRAPDGRRDGDRVRAEGLGRLPGVHSTRTRPRAVRLIGPAGRFRPPRPDALNVRASGTTRSDPAARAGARAPGCRPPGSRGIGSRGAATIGRPAPRGRSHRRTCPRRPCRTRG